MYLVGHEILNLHQESFTVGVVLVDVGGSTFSPWMIYYVVKV